MEAYQAYLDSAGDGVLTVVLVSTVILAVFFTVGVMLFKQDCVTMLVATIALGLVSVGVGMALNLKEARSELRVALNSIEQELKSDYGFRDVELTDDFGWHYAPNQETTKDVWVTTTNGTRELYTITYDANGQRFRATPSTTDPNTPSGE